MRQETALTNVVGDQFDLVIEGGKEIDQILESVSNLLELLFHRKESL